MCTSVWRFGFGRAKRALLSHSCRLVAGALVFSFMVPLVALADPPPITDVVPDHAFACGDQGAKLDLRVWIDYTSWFNPPHDPDCDCGFGTPPADGYGDPDCECYWLYSYVRLTRAGEADIIGVHPAGWGFDHDWIMAYFDLPEGTAEGWWSVVVTLGDPGSPEVTLPDAIYIDPTCPKGEPGDLYVANARGFKLIDPAGGHGRPEGNIVQYDGVTGEFVCVFAEGDVMVEPCDLTWGPNGNLFVIESAFLWWAERSGWGRVLEYDGHTGDLVREFVRPGAWNNGGLTKPADLAFGGPDGNLYVLDGGQQHAATDGVYEYDGQTGEFIRIIPIASSQPSGWIEIPSPVQLKFGPEGTLFILSHSKVGSGYCCLEEFELETGASLGCQVSFSVYPSYLPFYNGFTVTPDGTAWAITDNIVNLGWEPDPVELWDRSKIDFLGLLTDGDCRPELPGLGTAMDVAYGPGGDVFASGRYTRSIPDGDSWWDTGSVLQFDPATGECLQHLGLWTVNTPRHGELWQPHWMEFKPMPGDYGNRLHGRDWQVDGWDYDRFVEAFNGTATDLALALTAFDADHDWDVDCDDWPAFVEAWTGPEDPPAFAPCEGYTGDDDGDGVHNDDDVCPDTPAGVPVDPEGRPLADLDRNCAVDLADFAVFQLSSTGPEVP